MRTGDVRATLHYLARAACPDIAPERVQPVEGVRIAGAVGADRVDLDVIGPIEQTGGTLAGNEILRERGMMQYTLVTAEGRDTYAAMDCLDQVAGFLREGRGFRVPVRSRLPVNDDGNAQDYAVQAAETLILPPSPVPVERVDDFTGTLVIEAAPSVRAPYKDGETLRCPLMLRYLATAIPDAAGSLRT